MIKYEEVEKIAKLARLNFTSDEINQFTHDIKEIMDMIDELLYVDCSEVSPLTSVCEESQRFRNDIMQIQNITDDLFTTHRQLAKDTKCFIVPKVVE
jgi:aspartyl-tRNA(Asn)/glutamyl-tRNA(Gln) amidotransferase subunit C